MEIQDDLSILRKATGALAEWEEEKHPRKPAGQGSGGQFAPKGEGGAGGGIPETHREGEEEETPEMAGPDGGKKPTEKPERKVRGGVEDEINDHKGVWIDVPDKDWTVFVRDGETLDEAYARQLEEAVAGEWGKPAQRFAQGIKRDEEKKRRAEEKKVRAEAKGEGGQGGVGPDLSDKQKKMVEDAKKALVRLGNAKDEAEELVGDAIGRIGADFRDAADIVIEALGGREQAKREAMVAEMSTEAAAGEARPPKAEISDEEANRLFDEIFGPSKPGEKPGAAFVEEAEGMTPGGAQAVSEGREPLIIGSGYEEQGRREREEEVGPTYEELFGEPPTPSGKAETPFDEAETKIEEEVVEEGGGALEPSTGDLFEEFFGKPEEGKAPEASPEPEEMSPEELNRRVIDLFGEPAPKNETEMEADRKKKERERSSESP